jgi:DNA-directed RNA polymerase alpha subunit
MPSSVNRPLEELQLSVRARNALHRLGCETVQDVCLLDFNVSMRQLGAKTRLEVLDRLARAGFRPVLFEKPSSTEVRKIARGLDRVGREIRILQERLKKLG